MSLNQADVDLTDRAVHCVRTNTIAADFIDCSMLAEITALFRVYLYFTR